MARDLVRFAQAGFALVVSACSPAPTPSEPPAPPVAREASVHRAPASVPSEQGSRSREVFSVTRVRPITFGQSYAQTLPSFVAEQHTSERPLLPSQQPLWIFLDQHAPRFAGERLLTLSDLHAEDEDLAPGLHHLVLVKETEEEIGVQVHAVSIEVKPVGIFPSPGCVLLTQALTFNGTEAADDVRLLAVPLVSEISTVLYRAESAAYRGEKEVSAGTELRLISPPSGDIVLSATCFSGSEVRAYAVRTITVNRDAGEPSP